MELESNKSTSELKSKKFWASILGELLGTTFLVYIVSSMSSVCASDRSSCNNLQIALAYGLGVATLVPWTEGLLNPALTVVFTFTGRISFVKGILFIVMEISGGIAGAGLTYVLTPENQRSNTTLGDTVLHRDINIIQGFFLEFVLTFILTLAVYAAKDTGRKCEGYDVSLAYGFAVTVCHLVGYSYTCCSFNPSRSFGPAVVRQISDIGKPRIEWEYHWIYWIGPIGGSLLAGVMYRILFSQPSVEYDFVRAGNLRQGESETVL